MFTSMGFHHVCFLLDRLYRPENGAIDSGTVMIRALRAAHLRNLRKRFHSGE